MMTNGEEHQLEERLGIMEKRLGSIEHKLDQLIVTVRGSDAYGARGLAPRVADLERRVTRIERIMSRAAWVALGAGAAGAGLTEIIRLVIGG